MNEKWFKLSIAEIEKKLKTNAASGLSRKAARSRGNRGSGHLFYVPRRSVWRMVFEMLSDFALVILLLGAIFSLFFEIEEYLKGATVLSITVGALILCFIMYYRSQRTMESISSFFYPYAKVIRSGKLYAVDYRSVVVGDVILLEKGDIVCVDARLVTSDSLRVKMRVNANKFVHLEKNAGGFVAPNEIRVTEMTNMIHGGSVIVSGSARAVVTAVGKYTYLGAMTGGIPLMTSNIQPKLLNKLRKQCSKINMVTLICVLPFALISLLLGNMLSEHQSLLSVAFLTGVALAATTMPQLMCVLLNLYYTYKIRRLLTRTDPAVVRSVGAFDKFLTADYIFMLDGCAVTDGVLHFRSALCSEGEIRNYNALNKTSRMFSEYVSIYHTAATQMLTTGISGAGEFFSGLQSFTDKCNVDKDALKIRCSVTSYFPGNLVDSPERVLFTDRGISLCLSAWRDPKEIANCKKIFFGGEVRPLSSEGVKKFEALWKNAEASGETPILFTLSDERSGYSDACVLGVIILKEGIDPQLSNNLILLERLGCKIISFSRRGRMPKLPPEITGRGCVVKAAFERNKLPLTYNFGSISAYSDFSDADIIGLIDHAHSLGKKVIAVGFTEGAYMIASKADGFVTCAEIDPCISGYLNEELSTSETAGEEGSSSCTQTVKERADCLITRAKYNRGGLSSLIAVITEIRSVYRNISDYLRYTVCVQIVRLILVGLPMLLGDALLDARHVMLGAFVFDLFVFFAFMLRKNSFVDRRYKNYCEVNRIRDYLKGDKSAVLSSLIASLSAIILPLIADFVFGGYDYKLEGLFVSFVLLHLISFAFVYYFNNLKELKNLRKNILFMVEIAFGLILLGICFTVPQIGVLFGVEGMMPIAYMIISFMSPAIFAVIFLLLDRRNQMKKF